MTTFESREQLRAAYRPPGRPALDKQLDHIDEHCRAFIAHSPFAVVATADRDGGCDASPRGGPAGFVQVLDERHLSIPDLSGNNRLDTFGNIVEQPGVGLLFLIPGVVETLRVNGGARVERSAIDGSIAVVVEVQEAYIHCGKAVRRGALWSPEQWPDISDMPTPARMLRDQVLPQASVEQISHRLEQDYAETLWDPSRTAD